MITQLAIRNYALIEDLRVDLGRGLTIITGETGAGKSIILGALSLLLGKRADLSSVRDTDRKCIIEAEFQLGGYELEGLFREHHLDYDTHTILRREILPSGKSRAFVNDSPVTLNQLQALGRRLVDIHSQHEALALSSESFQFDVIDAFGGNMPLVKEYSNTFEKWVAAKQKLRQLKEQREQAHKELDYNTFLFNELEEARLDGVDLKELEDRFETLNNSEVIQESLAAANQSLENESYGALERLKEARAVLSKISGFTTEFSEFWERLNSAIIELEDLSEGLQDAGTNLESDPQALFEVNEKLQSIYRLQQKHTADGIEELLKLRDSLSEKVAESHGLDDSIERLDMEVAELKEKADTQSLQLHKRRSEAIPELTEKLESILNELGLPNGRLKFDLSERDALRKYGRSDLELLFTANLGSAFGPLKKVASGGELSRIMLAIKSVLGKYKKLPTIIFDEIDSGVSGEIANKMAAIMNDMSRDVQLLTITHLPQVAAKGDSHILVYKEDVDQKTETRLKKLFKDDRIVEIAKMIGGENVTEAALANARELLN